MIDILSERCFVGTGKLHATHNQTRLVSWQGHGASNLAQEEEAWDDLKMVLR